MGVQSIDAHVDLGAEYKPSVLTFQASRTINLLRQPDGSPAPGLQWIDVVTSYELSAQRGRAPAGYTADGMIEKSGLRISTRRVSYGTGMRFGYQSS